jgi:hypothetical protein
MWILNQERCFLCGLLLILSLPGLASAPGLSKISARPTRNAEIRSPKSRQCQMGRTSAAHGSWRWKRNAHVNVYYRLGQFSANDGIAFSEAVAHWNRALLQTDIGIRFELKGETREDIVHGPSILIVRGNPGGRDRVGDIKLQSIANGSVHLIATISSRVVDPRGLESLLTHELGHSLGLADCYDCKRVRLR